MHPIRKNIIYRKTTFDRNNTPVKDSTSNDMSTHCLLVVAMFHHLLICMLDFHTCPRVIQIQIQVPQISKPCLLFLVLAFYVMWGPSSHSLLTFSNGLCKCRSHCRISSSTTSFSYFWPPFSSAFSHLWFVTISSTLFSICLFIFISRLLISWVFI